jgi:hypothetical protein
MTDPTEVEAHFGEDGKITVLSFTWRGRRLPVTSMGREWEIKDGHHFLVMTGGEHIFELNFHATRGLWNVVRAPEERAVA